MPLRRLVLWRYFALCNCGRKPLIDQYAVGDDGKMQVCAGHAPGLSDGTEYISLTQAVTGFDIDTAEVCI